MMPLMASDLRGQLRRSYVLDGKRVLVLKEGCSGGIEVGDQVRVELATGELATCTVATVAWGSGFQATSPPLTLVVEGLEGDPAEEARVEGS